MRHFGGCEGSIFIDVCHYCFILHMAIIPYHTMCVCAHTCTYVCVHVCAHMCVYMCVHAYVCVCVCAHMCVFEYIYVRKKVEERIHEQTL